MDDQDLRLRARLERLAAAVPVTPTPVGTTRVAARVGARTRSGPSLAAVLVAVVAVAVIAVTLGVAGRTAAPTLVPSVVQPSAPAASGGQPATPTASAGPTATGVASSTPSPSGASADRYPDGLPRSFDGEPVLRGSAAISHAAEATDATPFLIEGWVTFVPGARSCPMIPSGGHSWARDCIRAQLGDVAGTRDDTLTAAITFNFVLDGLLSEPVVARVEVHDPRARACGAAFAECDRMMVVQQVLWSGDAATAPGPITPDMAAAAVNSVEARAGLTVLGPGSTFFSCSISMPTATILLPSPVTDTVPGVTEVDVEPTTAARKRALDVGEGATAAFARAPLCSGMSGNNGTLTTTEDRSLVVANVAVVLHLHGPATAADRAFVARLAAALEAAASAGAGPSPSSAPSSAPSPTPGASPAVSVPAAACTADQLQVSSVGDAAGLGTVSAWLRFRNVSDRRCSLRGWPTLVGVTAAGTTTVARRSNVPLSSAAAAGIQTVTLAPGDSAVAEYEGSDNSIGTATSCPSYRTLRVTPPGTSRAVTLSAWNAWLGHDLPACTGIEVTMVVSPDTAIGLGAPVPPDPDSPAVTVDHPTLVVAPRPPCATARRSPCA